MRIDERNLNEAAASTAHRLAETQRIQTRVGTAGEGAAPGGDRVDLSGLAGRISQSMQSLSARSAQRVSQLQREYQAGRYQPDAARIGHAVAAEWLSGAAE
jgi:Anti-sigma-28 factor, FlgM